MKFARIIKERLTDGSFVYNVAVRASGDQHDAIVLCAEDCNHADKLAKSINSCSDVERAVVSMSVMDEIVERNTAQL